MISFLSEHQLVALIGLLTGIPLGLAARLGRFCTLGAIEDALYGGSTVRLRMWGMAIGLAVVGSFTLMATGLLTGADTFYLSIRWAPMASILGGLVFGYGMALSGNCGYGAIARLGGGDLRSFVIVLVMGVATFVVLSGPLAPVRAMVFPQTEVTTDVPPGIAHQLSALSGVSVNVIRNRCWPVDPCGRSRVPRGLEKAGAGRLGRSGGSGRGRGLGGHHMGGARRVRGAAGGLTQLCSTFGRHDPLVDDRQCPTAEFRCRIGGGRLGRGLYRLTDQGAFPLGSLRRSARIAPPDHWCGTDGRRRGCGAGLFHRSGPVGLFGAGNLGPGDLCSDLCRGGAGPAAVDSWVSTGRVIRTRQTWSNAHLPVGQPHSCRRAT